MEEEEKKRDRFKEALLKRLQDEPVHSEEEDNEIWAAMKMEMKAQPIQKKGVLIRMNWYAYAASIAFGLIISGILYFSLTQQHTQQIAGPTLENKDSTLALPAKDKSQLAKQNSENPKEKSSPKSVSPQLVEVKSSGIEDHNMLDGSLVALNKNASLTYKSDFKEKRSLSLEGEAYFQVESDKKHPFTVHFGEHRLEVVGTKFNVRSLQDQKAEISVTEGIVRVFPNGEGKGVLVKKNEQVLLQGNKATVSTVNALNYIAWKTGDLSFEDTRMEQVAKLLARQYQVHMELDAAISECTFTGNLNKVSFENALKILEMTTSFKVKVKSNNVYYISGSGCD